MLFGYRFVIAWFVSGFVLTIALDQSALDQSVLAQTLTQQLQRESAEKLVLEARESGKIVRGAILFHQGNINCSKCHRATADGGRLAPDLSRLGDDVSDASLVDSILEPSKAISKGFETLNVLTNDGRVINGLVVDRDDKRIVMRDIQDIDKQHELPLADIDLTRRSLVSAMPSGLADQLTGRQQFLDLLRYVIDVKERGPTKTMASGRASPSRQLTSELRGLVLIRDRNCAGCHESSAIDLLPAAHQSPDLKWSAKHLNPRHLARFIADPHNTKPGTTMPAVLGHMRQRQKQAAAEAIVHFLVSIGGNEFSRSDSRPDSRPDSESIESGRELFHSVGCVACHSPRDDDAVEHVLVDSVAMGNLSNKYDHESLVAFLENPHVARPGGRMPSMQLAHREAQDLADYLLQDNGQAASAVAASWTADAELIARGKQLFGELNCAKCHSGVTEPAAATSSPAKLADANPDAGCLSSVRGNWPDFALTETQTEDIKAALESQFVSGVEPLDAQQTIDLTITSFRCIACHSRDSLGGVDEQRRGHFQTTNLNLGEQGSIPPTLTGVGAKLNPKWMRDVLVNGRSIRPYMKTRMPQFGEQNVGHLIDLFQATDKLSETEFATVDDPKESRQLGLKIVGTQGLNCAACHTYQYKLADTMPAVDLTEMAQRLKKDWFYQYMLAPQTFSPNTVMPSYWPGGKALRPDIAGAPNDQIEAIWQYLLDGRQARAPAGVIREPLEIVVTDEARMLRRKYSEIGKRGIGVGYPGGVNLVYDAQQMRLATIWKGKFVDPAAAWYGQGSGNVRELGQTIRLPKGPELFDPAQPRITDNTRPVSHQFKGYVLDERRRPTMRYRLGPIEVTDYFSEFDDDKTDRTQLRRQITLNSSEERKQLRFRLASGDDIELLSDAGFRIDDRLTIRVASGQIAEVTDGNLLSVPLTLSPNQTQEIVIEYFWE